MDGTREDLAPDLAITGSTGWLGGLVAGALAARGVSQRLLARDASRATYTLARDHWATEEHLRASGMTWTFLRDNLYLEFMDQMVGPDGVIRGPAGDGRAAVVSHDDIARAAVAVLSEPAAHVGRTYDLTGPEALSFAEMATLIREVTGRDVSFHDETIEEAYASRAA